MKVLYVDFEQGYKSLGSAEDIKNDFGYPMLQFDKYSDFKKLLGSLFERKVVQQEVQIGTVKVPQETTKWVKKDGVDVDCIVLDTGTELVKKSEWSDGNEKNIVDMHNLLVDPNSFQSGGYFDQNGGTLNFDADGNVSFGFSPHPVFGIISIST